MRPRAQRHVRVRSTFEVERIERIERIEDPLITIRRGEKTQHAIALRNVRSLDLEVSRGTTSDVRNRRAQTQQLIDPEIDLHRWISESFHTLAVLEQPDEQARRARFDLPNSTAREAPCSSRSTHRTGCFSRAAMPAVSSARSTFVSLRIERSRYHRTRQRQHIASCSLSFERGLS